jgi:hypothetical protein
VDSHALFAWGAAGAFTNFLAVYLLPELTRYLRNDNRRIIVRRPVLLAIIGILLVAAGGVITMGLAPSDQKSAFLTGVGGLGLVRGLTDGGSSTLRRLGAEEQEGENPSGGPNPPAQPPA